METDLLERGGLEAVDPLVHGIIASEAARQDRKLILIASESICPAPVREALASPFSNLYAEGYPGLRMCADGLERLSDLSAQLAHFQRLSDRRYYRGCEYADLVEAVARRRLSELFANERVGPDGIFANVQPLSGAAANNAVYEAFVEPGGVVMGMSLSSGGHLTHGSPVNRSGRHYRIVSYGVTAQGKVDYDGMRALALEHRPRIIIAGFSAFPWSLDWERLRSIADECGALLVADIAHTAGLIAGRVLASPIGHAQVITFTTHKTLCGPRGAAILTTDRDLARRIDTAVFPGEQGGPHINSIAAKAVCFQLAMSERFRALQRRVVENAAALANAFEAEGLPVAYGGTDTHMTLIDCSRIKTRSGEATSGELLARALDTVGLVVNKNTIAGDRSPVYPSAVRFGTTWVSQRGLGPAQMRELGRLVARTAGALFSFTYHGGVPRGRIDLAELESIREEVARVAGEAKPAEGEIASTAGYPHFVRGATRDVGRYLVVRGRRAVDFLHATTTANLLGLAPAAAVAARVLDASGSPLGLVALVRLDEQKGEEQLLVMVREGDASRIAAWLRALSDGWARFDDDLYRKVPGPVVVEPAAEGSQVVKRHTAALEKAKVAETVRKAFFVGEKQARAQAGGGEKRSAWVYSAQKLEPRKTPLYDMHLARASKGQVANFAGWYLPVYFAGIKEEHKAVRGRAGIFDVAHMGVLEVSGRGAERFLDLVTTNAVTRLRPGRAHYSYLLAPDGRVIDDILIYRRGAELFMVVVNAANAEEDEAWLRALLDGSACLDPAEPTRSIEVQATLRNLKDPSSGDDRRVDTALQGPRSTDILSDVINDSELRAAVAGLGPFGFVEGKVAGLQALVSRTGYTGEKVAYEIYVHPDAMVDLWHRLLAIGERYGLEPAGLGARDSTRTEAGLPLHGHELAGAHSVNPIEAGYGSFVKLHKAWFVGRDAMVAAHRDRSRTIVRFEVREAGGRMIRPGCPVVGARRSTVIGKVTSCTMVDETQVGMALVPSKLSEPGTELAIYPVPSREPKAKTVSELGDGDAVVLPRTALVVERFRR